MIALLVLSPSSTLRKFHSEAEFIAISMKVRLGDVMEYAMHASFQQGKVRFDSVRVNVTASIFFLAMIYDLVAAFKFDTDAVISLPFIG